MPNPAVLLIEGSDFETIPAGGQLAMVRALLKLFGDRLALVGMNRGDGPTGRWIQKEISGTAYPFFPVANLELSGKRPFIPARLRFYTGLRRWKHNILSLGCKAAFIQAPEALLAASYWDWNSLCFWFPGVENPLKASRYPYAKPLWRLFDNALFSALDRANVILAAADDEAINALVSRSNGRLERERLIQLPTCVDTSLFHPAPPNTVRPGLGIPANCTVFVTVGRIGRFKGWELLLDAFEHFLRRSRSALLFFVGDGEDRSPLQAQIDARGLDSKVTITGFQNPNKIAAYLNAADAVISGSLLEGWSVATLEALACGKVIVSTQVSGVTAMIKPGQNGFIVKTRDAAIFANAMEDALQLSDAEQVSTSIAARFDLTRMGEKLARLWPPLRGNNFTGADCEGDEHLRVRSEDRRIPNPSNV
jgi:glycosyltransferase involved in cell wall biosynthesis